MNSLIKYRIHELAKDFGMTSKEISQILAEYSTPPKNHMQILTGQELNLVFDYLTQKHQVADLESVLSSGSEASGIAESQPPVSEAIPEPEVITETKQTETATPDNKPVDKPETSEPKQESITVKDKHMQDNRSKKQADKYAEPPQKPRPQQPVQPKTQPQQKPIQLQQLSDNTPAAVTSPAATTTENVPFTPQKKREVRIIDTRGANVNLSKYDESVDRLVPEKAQNMAPAKQKLVKRNTNDNRRGRPGQSTKRNDEQEALRRMQLEARKKIQLKVSIPDEISVGELALRLKKTGAEVVKQLIKQGVMASVSQIIDYDTAALVALEFGAKVEKEVHVTIEERLIDSSVDTEENLELRSPVVVVMGHVDHGKTSLLDNIRRSHVATSEAGGITQHIGAYIVDYNGSKITFLDTPGHAAFTSMRARGANITDIAILVVAADDGIKPQTVEAINHAKSANVPIIVAINKMDRPNANPERVVQQLTEHGLVSEEWGGDTIICKVSALTGEGIDNLLEMLLLAAEICELKANPNRNASGTVIEARLDHQRGPIATLLVQNGTLRTGDTIIAGTTVGHVRAMADYNGERLAEAGPSTPVEVIGLSEAPMAGDSFYAVEDERMARELVEERKIKERESSSGNVRVTLDDFMNQMKQGAVKDLNIIIKADVMGSVEALRTSLEKLSNDEVRVKVIHSGVGAINETDVLLASTSSAVIVGFNIRPTNTAAENAKRAGVDIRMYRVIYDCIDEVQAAIKGMLAPKYTEEILGQAEIRQVFKATNIGTVAGCYVQSGKFVRGAKVRVIRDSVVVHDGTISSIRRFKDDVREVAQNYECGITIDNFTDYKLGDILEDYQLVEIKN